VRGLFFRRYEIVLGSAKGQFTFLGYSSSRHSNWLFNNMKAWEIEEYLSTDPKVLLLEQQLRQLTDIEAEKNKRTDSPMNSEDRTSLRSKVGQLRQMITAYYDTGTQEILSRLPLYDNYSGEQWGVDASRPNGLNRPGFEFRRINGCVDVKLPYWFLVTLAGSLAAIPSARKIRKRFSLRTLLIAMTLIALVLGLLVAVLR
jgi:hypothetical protein